jgi:phosphatidylglycerol:prolipoprotein diacylglycerol transferase
MWPHDIIVGPVVFNGYGLMVAAGVVFGLYILKYSAPPAGTTFTEAFNLSLKLIIAGLLGARLAYVATHLSPFLRHPSEILMYWRGGLMFQGGLLGGVLLAVYLAAKGRFKLSVMGDALAPGLALGQGIGRLGCFLAGCCYGLPAPRWLGIAFPSSSQAPWGIPLYPTQLMEAAALVLLAAGLLASLKRRPASAPLPTSNLSPDSSVKPPLAPSGRILALYLFWSGLIRLIMEFFRGDDRGPAIFAHTRPTTLAALFISTIGLLLWLYLRRPPRSSTRLAADPADRSGAF